MPTEEWKTECPVCRSEVYYYPGKFNIQPAKRLALEDDRPRPATVSLTCTGKQDPQGKTHVLDYAFPEVFSKSH